jgi:hypothetical protein
VRIGGLLHRRSDSLGHEQSLLGGHAPQHQEKLLAAVAVGGVTGPEDAADRGRDHPQRLVTRQVAEAVVVGLETVCVAEGDGNRLALLALRPVKGREVARKGPAVAHAGQRIPARVIDQLAVQVRELPVEPSQLGLTLGHAGQRLPLALQQAA